MNKSYHLGDKIAIHSLLVKKGKWLKTPNRKFMENKKIWSFPATISSVKCGYLEILLDFHSILLGEENSLRFISIRDIKIILFRNGLL
ncbi:unnamed protein product [Blepharisma stoltei]|uniref:Uncharacterized protein n=1 Tax=Blepharisma stoltei TaxID=1481888 RepID=A0AAU9KHW3_9CILI|nr:unnamed protein product [Blepharisma stoltei]